MNFKIIFLLLSLPFILEGNSARNALKECCGKCVGSSYCTVCTTCNYCKHCNSGGSCGVCGGGSSGRGTAYGNTNRGNYRTNPEPKEPLKKTRYIQYYISTRYLNVRSGPGTTYAIIDKLTYRTNIHVETIYPNGWCFIHYYGYDLTLKSGYVAKVYIDYLYP